LFVTKLSNFVTTLPLVGTELSNFVTTLPLVGTELSNFVAELPWFATTLSNFVPNKPLFVLKLPWFGTELINFVAELPLFVTDLVKSVTILSKLRPKNGDFSIQTPKLAKNAFFPQASPVLSTKPKVGTARRAVRTPRRGVPTSIFNPLSSIIVFFTIPSSRSFCDGHRPPLQPPSFSL
jgi:hypothetical protein